MVARAALAAIVPMLLFGWVGVRQPVHIDGAMNLQVAHELAFRGDYARSYEFVPLKAPQGTESAWHREHPAEVQTNGPYILVAAVAAGGDRQQVHERIRQHSLAAAARLKAGPVGTDNDLRLLQAMFGKRDPKSGNWDYWPDDIRVREYPRVDK